LRQRLEIRYDKTPSHSIRRLGKITLTNSWTYAEIPRGQKAAHMQKKRILSITWNDVWAQGFAEKFPPMYRVALKQLQTKCHGGFFSDWLRLGHSCINRPFLRV